MLAGNLRGHRKRWPNERARQCECVAEPACRRGTREVSEQCHLTERYGRLAEQYGRRVEQYDRLVSDRVERKSATRKRAPHDLSRDQPQLLRVESEVDVRALDVHRGIR